MWFVKSLANRASKAVLRCMPILLTALLLPKPYGLALPPDVKTAVLFLLSMILGFLVVVAFSMLIYIATFFTLSPLGIRVISLSLVEFMSGGIIPLPFLPGRIRGIMELLPFASMQNAPYRIYSANIAGAAAVSTLSLQLFWVIALTVLGHYLMSLALKHAVIQGG
jgi:ABC-2 type transport system permease protein